MTIRNSSVKISNYKCFGNEPQGFEQISPINIIIGRNNAGKSSLLDLIELATNTKNINKISRHAHRQGSPPALYISKPLTETDISAVFPENVRGGSIPSHGSHWDYGRFWIGKKFEWKIEMEHKHTPIRLEPPFKHRDSDEHMRRLCEQTKNPLHGKQLLRLLADRDIQPEPQLSRNIERNGAGATGLITNFITNSLLNGDLVEKTLLDDLNKIFHPDSAFERITTRRPDEGSWEIFLDEEGKGRISLSNSGSGLKTIILSLALIHLVPEIKNHKLSQYTLILEEPENNLHPAMQRRLMRYLRTIALKHECYFFITTHSSAIIDYFGHDSEAQIVHVTHNRTTATSRRVATYIERQGILDDLDIRASDLLQSNCVVWVEGPTDRIYFNRWIELWTNGELSEGLHYQCIFYGGRLLSHLSGTSPDHEECSGIKILHVNRHAVLLMDSDRKEAGDTINASKQRLEQEICSVGGYCWVTAGREVENYIPTDSLRKFIDRPDACPLEQHEKIGDYLSSLNHELGPIFDRKKVMFAEAITPLITKHELESTLDMAARLMKVTEYIRKVNGLTDA
ncbi:ATP-dependent nuclease [Sorangium sp. So ce406]|uniref:ATP-dependent nuclease n=1 Tax=Sorangium sp. So ce406 TaxID=3133311 RepID=UPI003F5BBDB7